jgi:hypothetical protein
MSAKELRRRVGGTTAEERGGKALDGDLLSDYNRGLVGS